MAFSDHKMNVFVTIITVIEVEKSNEIDVFTLHRCQLRLVRPLEYIFLLFSYRKIHFVHDVTLETSYIIELDVPMKPVY